MLDVLRKATPTNSIQTYITLKVTTLNVLCEVTGTNTGSIQLNYLVPYNRPLKISSHGRTKDWGAFRKNPLLGGIPKKPVK